MLFSAKQNNYRYPEDVNARLFPAPFYNDFQRVKKHTEVHGKAHVFDIKDVEFEALYHLRNGFSVAVLYLT